MYQAHLVSGLTINETIYKAFDHLHFHGLSRGSRNGGSKAVYHTTYMIENPRERHLHLNGRKSNIFQLIAETFWVLAGANAVAPYLEFFLPRAPQYSDDGVTWHGAYGPRMYANNQHIDALNVFKVDGVDSRRSFITISDPRLDNQEAIEVLYGEGHKAKDIPCNREIQFSVFDGKWFTAKTIQRSGDMLFGAGSINPFEFSLIHELMYHELKKFCPEVKLGPYMWHVSNAHVYDQFYSQVEAVLDPSTPQVFHHAGASMDTIGPAIEKWQEFFSTIIAHFGYLITKEDISQQDSVDLDDWAIELFNEYEVPLANNNLLNYVYVVGRYIVYKRIGFETGPASYFARDPNGDINVPQSLYEAVRLSSFLPKQQVINQ